MAASRLGSVFCTLRAFLADDRDPVLRVLRAERVGAVFEVRAITINLVNKAL